MARSRRPAMKRKRVPKDWVTNPLTYVSANVSLASGIAGVAVQPLTFSQNAQRQVAFGSTSVAPALGEWMHGAAFPERGNQQVFAVSGVIQVEPSSWALGNFIRFGWRLAVFDMDPVTAGAGLNTGYSMFAASAGTLAYQHANTGFLAEGRIYQGFGDGDLGRQCVVRWSSSRGIRIGADRALYLFMEADSSSVSLRVRPFVRTLMRVP